MFFFGFITRSKQLLKVTPKLSKILHIFRVHKLCVYVQHMLGQAVICLGGWKIAPSLLVKSADCARQRLGWHNSLIRPLVNDTPLSNICTKSLHLNAHTLVIPCDSVWRSDIIKYIPHRNIIGRSYRKNWWVWAKL